MPAGDACHQKFVVLNGQGRDVRQCQHQEFRQGVILQLGDFLDYGIKTRQLVFQYQAGFHKVGNQ